MDAPALQSLARRLTDLKEPRKVPRLRWNPGCVVVEVCEASSQAVLLSKEAMSLTMKPVLLLNVY